MAVRRVALASHLTRKNVRLAAIKRQRLDDTVITMALRTPMCKANKGGFKYMRSDELLLETFKAAIANSNVAPEMIEDICVGTVLNSNSAYDARAAALAAGFPESTTTQVVNRFCGSGLMAANTISNQIRSGQIEIGLAVGSESMSSCPDERAQPFSEEIRDLPSAKDCEMPPGWTSEVVAQEFNISREDMDAFAALSFQRAEAAQKSGKFTSEIVPIHAWANADPSSEARSKLLISQDDGIRPGTTVEILSKIRSAFPEWGGVTTGGNASQKTDGAAVILLMSRRKANELGLKIIGKYVTVAVSGNAPRIMGISPILAIPKVLKAVGISKEDVDLFEINEAFASMYVYCVRQLGLDINKVNVNGGAISLGHPLGATGIRQAVTGLTELERRDANVLVTSMCIATGMGAAAVWVREA